MKNKYYHFSYFKSVSAAAEKCLLVSDAMAYTADSEFLMTGRFLKIIWMMYVLEDCSGWNSMERSMLWSLDREL